MFSDTYLHPVNSRKADEVVLYKRVKLEMLGLIWWKGNLGCLIKLLHDDTYCFMDWFLKGSGKHTVSKNTRAQEKMKRKLMQKNSAVAGKPPSGSLISLIYMGLKQRWT